MATCPRCFGALSEHHRCPRGRLSRVTDALSTVAVGGIVGTVLCYAVNDQPVPALVLAAAALGSVLATALRQAISGKV
jgi:peptidoglycan/LPS O-acetylase OafA/YrhL